MEVILLEKIQGLGDLGDLVKVKPGYGRNYLIPQGKAARATKDNIAEFEKRREELEKRAREMLTGAEERAAALEGMEVTIRAKVSGEGRLYGSVTPREIADALEEKGLHVDKSEIIMDHGPLREVGEYDITISLHADVSAPIRVIVEGEELENEVLEELLEAEGESEPEESTGDDAADAQPDEGKDRE